jgi:hypothetical protein
VKFWKLQVAIHPKNGSWMHLPALLLGRQARRDDAPDRLPAARHGGGKFAVAGSWGGAVHSPVTALAAGVCIFPVPDAHSQCAVVGGWRTITVPFALRSW